MRSKLIFSVIAGMLNIASLAGCSSSSQIVLHDVQPDDGIMPVVEFVKSATKSIDISVYDMDATYKALVDPLVEAVKKGIPVRVSISANWLDSQIQRVEM